MPHLSDDEDDHFLPGDVEEEFPVRGELSLNFLKVQHREKYNLCTINVQPAQHISVTVVFAEWVEPVKQEFLKKLTYANMKRNLQAQIRYVKVWVLVILVKILISHGLIVCSTALIISL